MESELMTLKEVAAYMKVGNMTISKWVREGKLPMRKIGKGYRIRRSDLEEWYEVQLDAMAREHHAAAGSPLADA